MTIKWVLAIAVALGSAFLVLRSGRELGSMSVTEAADPAYSGDRVPVIVELFTSEGCSSCPPADQLLSKLDQTQPVPGAQIIALSEHVDYWNRLGWSDPFSSSQFSQRQDDYARSIRGSETYTPQMIVNGEVQFIGSSASSAQRAIASAAASPRASVTLSLSKSSGSEAGLAVSVSGAHSGANVMLAITESGLLSNVSRGENAGRKLTHSSVVRSLKSIGKVDGQGRFSSTTSVTLESAWKPANIRAVVFVQEPDSLKILGGAQTSLNAPAATAAR